MKPSKSGYLTDAYFDERYLYLLPIRIDVLMGSKFLNLIAYKGCLDFENDFGVTSYICFLDSLIDHPGDVKDLRKARIPYNFLASDKEVAQLFNYLGAYLVPNPKTYANVRRQIQECYENKWKTWIAQVTQDHFSNPWTIVGFGAALLTLGLTSIQTWFTVFPLPGSCDKFFQHNTIEFDMIITISTKNVYVCMYEVPFISFCFCVCL